MKIIGHRGAKGLAPENTIDSFREAIEHGVDIIEMDLRYHSGIEEIVVAHDRIDSSTYELTTPSDHMLRAVPTLKEVLSYFRRTPDFYLKDTQLYFDIKEREVVEPLMKMFKPWIMDRYLFASFDHHIIKQIKSIRSEAQTGALIGSIPINYAECAKMANADFIGVNYDHLVEDLVRDAHERNLLVYVFTVNDLVDVKKCREMEVDGLVTDYPNRFFFNKKTLVSNRN